MTSDLARAFLPHWTELRDTTGVSRLEGGELKDVFRIDAGSAAFALRVYQPQVSRDDVASEMALVAPFARRLDEVPNAIPARDGALLAVEHGRVAVLAPFVEGSRLDRRDRAQRRAAAELLARLHAIAAAIESPRPRRAPAPYRDFDWHENGWWSWPDIEAFLRAHDLTSTPVDAGTLRQRIDGELAAAPHALRALAALDLPSMPIHNDYFPGNLLWHNGQVAAVIDWDETNVDWRALEVANASIEFSQPNDDQLEPDPALVRDFLRDYVAAGGELLDRERAAMLRLRKLRLLMETLYELGRACRGLPLDEPYLWRNLTSLDSFGDDLFRL